MKILVISDSHTNLANLRHALGFGQKIKVGGIIHCGDWNSLTNVVEVLSFKIPLYTVLGNADIDPNIKDILTKKTEKFEEEYLEFELGKRMVGVIHNIGKVNLKNKNLDILFYGHTHKKGEKFVGRIKFVNPGALHSNKPSFAVYDTDTNNVEFFEL